MQIQINTQKINQRSEEIFIDLDKKLDMAQEEFPKIRDLIYNFDQMYKNSVSEYMSKLNSEEDRLYKGIEKMFGVYEGKLAESFQELNKEEENLNERFQKVFLEYKKRLENEFNEIGEGTEFISLRLLKHMKNVKYKPKRIHRNLIKTVKKFLLI